MFLGRQGDDELFAQAGDITLKGGKGNDLLLAREGLSWYSGGPGADMFVFIDPTKSNKINDFSVEDGDLFNLNTVTFIGIGPGLIDDAQFKIGKQASTPEQIIIYQPNKGNLWYDQDGSGLGLRAGQVRQGRQGPRFVRPELLRRGVRNSDLTSRVRARM